MNNTSPSPNLTPVHIHLDKHLYKEVKKTCLDLDISLRSFLTDAIVTKLNNERKALSQNSDVQPLVKVK